MGATGILIGGDVKRAPLAGTIKIDSVEKRQAKDFQGNDLFNSLSSGGTEEYGVLFDENGNAYMAYKGDEHSVHIGDEVLRSTGSFTHYHPDSDFGGTLSMQDLKVFAQSNLMELRAFSQQGQLYSIEAKEGADRQALARWVKANQRLQQRNFEKAYDRAYKMATTPLKSGPNKGKVKITNPRTKQSIYREPMTKEQAAKFARTVSVGQYDRMYKKAFAPDGVMGKAGFSYKSTKKGAKNQ